MRRSTIDMLPVRVREKLENILINDRRPQMECLFWLQDEGYLVSRSALNRYALKLFDTKADSPQSVDRGINPVALIAAAFDLLSVARRAESFIAGFEGDELQEDISSLLSDLREAIRKAHGGSA